MLLTKAVHLTDLKLGPVADEIGTFSGYASTFGNIDRDDDIIDAGAFLNIDDPKAIRMLWAHDMRQPIGVWTTLRQDAKGLYAEGSLNLAVQQGREAHALLRQGAIDSMSIGFRSKQAVREITMRDGREIEIRRIKSIQLFEISLVAIPANANAKVGSVKSADLMTEREFEAHLRDALGLSRSQAQTVIAKGFRALVCKGTDDVPPRDAEGDKGPDVAALFKAAVDQLHTI